MGLIVESRTLQKTFSENAIPIALLQNYYETPIGYLGNIIGIENGGNIIAIVFLFGNHSGKIEKLI